MRVSKNKDRGLSDGHPLPGLRHFRDKFVFFARSAALRASGCTAGRAPADQTLPPMERTQQSPEEIERVLQVERGRRQRLDLDVVAGSAVDHVDAASAEQDVVA